MNTDKHPNISYERLLAYVQGELPDEISLEIEMHLMTHPEDRAVVDGIIAMRKRFANNEAQMEAFMNEQEDAVRELIPQNEEEPARLYAMAGAPEPAVENKVLPRRERNKSDLHLPVPQKREPIITPSISPNRHEAKRLENELTSRQASYLNYSEFNTMSESSIPPTQQEEESKTISIPETNLGMLSPLDENEFLHQVLSRRKAASRIQKGENDFEQDLGVRTSLSFDSFPIVRHTLERIEWLKERIGERNEHSNNGIVRDALDKSLNGDGWLEKLGSESDNEEINKNFDSAEKYHSWKREVLTKYVGEQKEQWAKFFASDYSLQDELRDQAMYKENSGKFFWNSFGLGLIYVFCSVYLWSMISAFSFTHLLLALGYVFILVIFPDRWMQQLFGKGQAPISNSEGDIMDETPPSKSLFWVRLMLTFFLSLSLIYVSEGLPVWTEYFSYFAEYSPYWLMIWAMSFALLHFLPAYRRKTTFLYKNTITPYRRFKANERSLQQQRLMELLEQGDKWSKEMLSDKERLRNERNEALFNGELVRRKRMYETQLERLGYLYDLGMGGEESSLNASFRRPRSRRAYTQEDTLRSE